MVSKKRFAGTFAFVFACVLMACALALGACGNESSSSASSSTSATSDDPYGLVSPGTLTVVTYAENEPMEYMEGSSFTGFDIALISEIANRLELSISIMDEPFDLLLAEVSNDDIADCAISSIEISDSWTQGVLFSDPYLDVSTAVVVSESSKIANVAELSRSRIGVLAGSAAETWAKENLPDASFTPFRETSDMFGALILGTIDAAACDGANAAHAIESAGLKCRILALVPTGEHYGIAMNGTNSALADAINGVLAEMEADGTMAKLKAQWLEAKSK